MTRVAVLVNGGPGSAMAERAHGLFERLPARFDVHLAFRSGNKVAAAMRFLRFLTRVRPDVCYVMDMSYSGVLAGTVYRGTTRTLLVIDTGDVITELVRSAGSRGRVGTALTAALEWLSLRSADQLVVRGTFHQRWLRENGRDAEVIQDGVDPAQFESTDDAGLRRKYGLEKVLTVGVVGSSVWSDRLQQCYGVELVELMRELRDPRVKGVMIGDGSGIAHLKRKCREYGIEDRILFLGRIPYEELPAHLAMLDVCVSTQTDDLVGWARTTGKLPLYMAAGRFVLASRVGEATLVLDDEMLVDYHGTLDPEYPERLRRRVERVLAEPERLAAGARNRAVAKERFDYAVLARRLEALLDRVVERHIPDHALPRRSPA